MIKQVQVFYNGWGEHWLWGRLLQTSSAGRPTISFEYSDEALAKGLELSSYTLPLEGPKLRQGFPQHQWQLPGPVYDALPDGWGLLLMDRLFKRQGINPHRVSPLERLSYIGNRAMGALRFQPIIDTEIAEQQDVSLLQLAVQVQNVLQGEGGEFLARLLKMGGSPQGARPKILLYQNPKTLSFSTEYQANSEAWLVKFPAHNEAAEVCAIEKVYSHCLSLCGIETPASQYIPLPEGMAAFASKRFDRQGNLRIPMQTLAAFTGANYQVPGSLDYKSFLRASFACTQDASQQKLAFERIVFNVVFNNRDDHPKNFSYVMNKQGEWRLAPAYDITFCEGPAGYHQMDVLGEALDISRSALLSLATEEAGLSNEQAAAIIEKHCAVAERFTAIATELLPKTITQPTLSGIQQRIEENIKALLA